MEILRAIGGWWIFIVIVDIVMAVFAAIIAVGKGHSGAGFFFFGLVCPPIAIATACLLTPWDSVTGLSLDALAILKKLDEIKEQTQKKDDEKLVPVKETVQPKQTKMYNDIQKGIKDVDEKVVCNHENKSRYLIYIGKNLSARRELCEDCANRLKQEGYGVIKSE